MGQWTYVVDLNIFFLPYIHGIIVPIYASDGPKHEPALPLFGRWQNYIIYGNFILRFLYLVRKEFFVFFEPCDGKFRCIVPKVPDAENLFWILLPDKNCSFLLYLVTYFVCFNLCLDNKLYKEISLFCNFFSWCMHYYYVRSNEEDENIWHFTLNIIIERKRILEFARYQA